jgi:NADH-quinone oxidoreductase subunit D
MKEFILPFGPQHPAIIEPLHLRLKVNGEKITGVDLQLGYNHRGIEKIFESRWWIKNIYLAERICGICGHAHTSAYLGGVEKLLNIQITPKAAHTRLIIFELERLHSHMLALGIMALESGFDTLFHYVFRDRELVMEMLELLSGNRVHFSMNVLGGVRKDIEKKQQDEVEKRLDKLEERVNHYLKVFQKDMAFVRRMRGIGVLSERKANELNPVGPVARASGIKHDIRNEDYFVYSDLKFKMVMGENGDVLERTVVRLKECLESIRLIREAFIKMPQGDLASKFPPIVKVPAGEATSSVEAPRGELFYYIKSDGSEKPYRVKIRTPTYANMSSIKEMLSNSQLADVPVIVASMDPCISCTDRMTIIDSKTRKEKILTKEDLRNMNICER